MTTYRHNRLTDDDRNRIGARVNEIAAMWRQSSTTRRAPSDWSTVHALIRAGAHAIGCSVYDLRVAEFAEIERYALDAIQEANR